MDQSPYHLLAVDQIFLHTGYGYLIFYPGIEILSYPCYLTCHVRTVHWLYWNSHTGPSSDIIVMSK